MKQKSNCWYCHYRILKWVAGKKNIYFNNELPINGRINEWISEWLNEWVTDWLNEWMNEWLNEWTKCNEMYKVLLKLNGIFSIQLPKNGW